MKTPFLFPYYFRFIGIVLILIHIPLMMGEGDRNNASEQSYDNSLFNGEHIHFLTTAFLVMIGLFFIAFSRERIEDEQISKLRLDSLQWAVYFNYLVLVITAVFMNGSNFMHILELNLWLPLLFLIIRFRWVIFRLNRSAKLEK